MIGILKQTIRMKSGLVNQLLGFIAIFIILLREFVGTTYLEATMNTLSGPMSVVTQIVAFLIGGVVLYYAISGLRQEDSESTNSLLLFMLNYFVGMGFIHLLAATIPIIMGRNDNVIYYLFAGLFVISLLGVGTTALSCWLICNNSAKADQVHRYLFKSISLYFSKFTYLVISIMTILLTALAITFLNHFFWPSLLLLNFSPLLMIFYKTTASACIIIAGTLLLIKSAYVIYADSIHYAPEGKSPVGFVLSGLFLLGIIYMTMPKMTNLVEVEYNRIIAQAEEYREEGQLYLSGNAYKKAYALMKAYNGYLMEMEVVKDKDATDEQRNIVRIEADTLFREAYEFYPNAGLIYYLDGLRFIEDNQGAALNAVTLAKQYDPELYQADLLKLEMAHALNQEPLIEQTVKDLISSEIFITEGNMNDLSLEKIEAALQNLEDSQEVILENITTIAYDYYNHQLYSEAMAELQIIKDIQPKDTVTNYLIAMTDLELKADNKAYTTAIEAAETILDEYPDEVWAQELYTGITLRAGNQTVLDEALLEAYKRNPDDLDVAEQYAYSILKKNYSSSYYEVTEEAETVIDMVLMQDSDRWFANYCKSLIDLYKGDYDSSVVHFNNFVYFVIEDSDLFAIQDELYNIYVMKYARRMTMDAAATEVLNNNESVDGFTYNYVMGAFGTMSHEVDTMGTIDYLDQAIAFNPRFSKPYYMMGNAYVEYGFQNSEPEYYIEAEAWYKKSMQIFEEDPYAWFALGHVYRKQERYKEALGAFQKTLTYMPAQDHQTDHFGVSIHSQYQISELERIVAEQEGK